MSKKNSSTSSSSESSENHLSLCQGNIQKKDYSKVRVLQKNVVYVIGLSSALANKNILSSYEYFGQYGKIIKIVVNKNGYNQNQHGETTYSAYVSYSNQEEASIALLAIDNYIIDGHVIRGSFGTTKYCTFFLKGIECANKDCLYLHEWYDEEDTITKDDIGANKHLFFQQQKIAAKIVDIFSKEKKRQILSRRKKSFNCATGGGFPPVESIYEKENLGDLFWDKRFSSSKFNLNSKNMNSSYKEKSDYNFNTNNDEDDMEYILVREPNKKKRRWKNNQKYQQTPLKIKPKYSLDDYKKKYLKKNISDSPTESKSSTKTNSSISFTSHERNNNLYRNPLKSRFDFVNDCKDSLEVPEFISDLIYMKMSSYSFFKKISKPSDESIFQKELTKIRDWNCTKENCELLF